MPSTRGKLETCPNCNYTWHRRIYRTGKRCPKCNLFIGELDKSDKIRHIKMMEKIEREQPKIKPKRKLRLQKKLIKSPQESPKLLPSAIQPEEDEEGKAKTKKLLGYYGYDKRKD